MFFEKIGIYGMQKIEKAVLAGLITGDPVLFIGSHGTAKTTLCRRLAEALGLKFFAYDASKALFEDMIGFPNPDSISRGEIEYVPTKLSIWDKEFILIDEISRARAEMQNKWLEIVRGRQVMGMKAEKLKYVFAAMNPPSYAGANPLDEALAGRFAFIIEVPRVSEMCEDEVRKVINNSSEEDAAAMGGKNHAVPAEVTGTLNGFLAAARLRMGEINSALGRGIDDYLVKFLFFASNKGVHIDGRRAGMLKRNILAYLAADELSGGKRPAVFEQASELVFEAVWHSMPFSAMNDEVPREKIRYLHESAAAFASEENLAVLELKSPEDVERIDGSRLREKYHFFRPALTCVIEKATSKAGGEDKPVYISVLRAIVKRVQDGTLALEENDSERVLEAYRSLTDMSVNMNYNYSGMHFFAALVREGLLGTSRKDIYVYKTVFNMVRNHSNDEVDFEKVRKLVKLYANNTMWR